MRSDGILALVPARGGSQGLPRKNLKRLGGHPLIAWAIAAGRTAPEITRVVCTTDCPEIAETARRYGAETPFLRPTEISGSLSTDLEAFQHALDWFRVHENWQPSLIVQLRPTSPFRERGLVSAGIARLLEVPDASCVRGVSRMEHSPFKCYDMAGDGGLTPLLTLPSLPEAINMPRQALPAAWRATGQLDVIRTEATLTRRSMTGDRLLGIETAGDTAVDIDTMLDLRFAEFILPDLTARIVLPEAPA